MSGFNFNLRKVLQEAASTDALVADTGIDEILSKNDLVAMFDKICPISGNVAVQLKEQMSDPSSLRIVYDESTNSFFMDYMELVNFCEATHKDTKAAVDTIIEAYSSEYPDFTLESFKVVFPQLEAFTSVLKGNVGYQDIAWSSQFLGDCINKGVSCVSFVDVGLSNGKKNLE